MENFLIRKVFHIADFTASMVDSYSFYTLYDILFNYPSDG